MTDPLDAVARLGADARPSDGSYAAAHRELLRAMHAPGGPVDRREQDRPSRRPIAPLLCAGAAVAMAVVLLALMTATRPTTSPPAGTGASIAQDLNQAQQQSTALRRAADLPRDVGRPLDRSSAARLVAHLEATVPMPPGQRSDIGRFFGAHRDRDMGVIAYARDALPIAHYRAWCSWLSYWLGRQSAGDVTDGAAASRVLADASRWPGMRSYATARTARQMSRAVDRGDAGAVQAEIKLNCRSVL